MYRKIVWCYIIVLTLLDISLNTKLSAQGKSHGNGVSVHETLIEGISLQEWGGGGGGVVSLSPAALSFGRRALAAAHALSVTVTNTANETIHLASVAGTTPDFHASFFHSKTLACGANTTFSVVYLGRHEGPARAHLYIHTSKGVHKYPVSAVGVASEYRVWPMVGLRVPQNATLEPLLTLYNPTDTTIQVSEVYSSGAWLGLALPDGRGSAPRALWSLPPRDTRPLVRLRLRLPHTATQHTTLHAYIRIKGNMAGGGLVVCVEVSPAPAGEYLSPAHVRLRTRGHHDKPDTMEVLAGSSAAGGSGRLTARALGACERTPPDIPPPDLDSATHNGGAGGAGGGEAGGVEVRLLRTHIEPYQELTRAADLTLDYGKMWASYEAGVGNGAGETRNGGGEGGAAADAAVYCGGWVTLGRAALPYSLRLLPGTLALEPTEMHVVVSEPDAVRARDISLHNQFPEPLRVTHVHFPKELHEHFITQSLAPLELAAGARGTAGRVQLRPGAAPPALRADIVLHTNLSDYTLPLLLYDGLFHFEWEKGEGATEEQEGALQLGGVGARARRELGLRLHNTGLTPLCLTRLHAHLPPPHTATLRAQERCAAGGSYISAWLEVVAGGEAGGYVRGAVEAHSPHGAARRPLLLRVLHGDLSAAPLHLTHAAPYVECEASLEVSSSMPQRVRVTHVTQAAAADPPEPALHFIAGEAEVWGARTVVGRVRYSPEIHCAPHCATGLDPNSEEGMAWLSRGQLSEEAALQADAALQRRRRARHAHVQRNYTLYLHTTEVVQVPVRVRVSETWPRVWAERAAAAGLCGVGGEAPLLVRLRNPATTPLLLQTKLSDTTIHIEEGEESAERDQCVGCVWSAASFSVGGWRDVGGGGGVIALTLNHSEYLLLPPQAHLELSVTFAPSEARPLAAYLYLRNNLTIVERVLLRGRGAHPRLQLGGREANASAPLVVEATGCGVGGGAGAARRTLVVRNTGRVPLRLRQWRVAGQPCGARALRLQPCAPLHLQPGEARPLHLHYHPDWTRSTTQATLTVTVGNTIARFNVVGAAPARLVSTCSASAGRAPLEAALRWGGAALALVAGAACLALGALDAERYLRAARAARPAPPPPPPRHPPPLDLRALAAQPDAPAPPAAPRPPRRAPRPRRAAPSPDPAAERRAFERWRAGVSRRATHLDDEEHSSEEGSPVAPRSPSPGPPPAAPPPPPPPPVLPRGDASSSSPDSSPPPRDSYSALCCGDEEEGGSSSESSSPGSAGEPRREPPPWPRPARRAPRPPAADHAPHPPARGSRARRSSAEARRSSRASLERRADTSSPGTNGSAAAPARVPPACPRPHARKERPGGGRRRAEPAPHAPPPEPRVAPPRHAAPLPPPPPPVRWGASWSDVVSRGNAPQHAEGGSAPAAPLAPIGSDVRRRLGSHSLFYYGGAPAAWPHADGPPPPTEEGGYRSLEQLWGGGAEPLAPGAPWLWGAGAAGGAAGGAVRPPPGFPAPRAIRPYDPFQSLASIWTPAALDWRVEADTTPPPPPPAPSPPRAEDAPPN